MKKSLKMLNVAGILLGIFLVTLMASWNTTAAVTVTGSVALLNATYHVVGSYKHNQNLNVLALTAVPKLPDFAPKSKKEQSEMDFEAMFDYRIKEKEYEKTQLEIDYITKLNSLEEAGTLDKETLDKALSDMQIIKDEHIAWGTKMKKLSEGAVSEFRAQEKKVHEWISTNADKIKEIKAQGHGFIELKVVGPMETTSASNPDGIPELAGVQMAPPSNVPLRGTIVRPLVTTIPTSAATYAYTESVPKDGNYDFVLEKGTKPQIDFEIQTRYAEPKKVAAHTVLTEESVQDIPQLQSIATDYLRKKHDLKWENGILFGDGIGANPKGAIDYARAFSAGPLANKVDAPNIMDVINAMITDAYTTHNFTDEMPYMPNLSMMHPADFFVEFVAKKDENGLPLFPTASLFNTVTIGGVKIIPFEDITAGDVFVADMKKYNVTNYVGYTVKIGWINDQLITNQFTMVGESRFHAFVKNLDEQAFIYDEIAVVKAALQST